MEAGVIFCGISLQETNNMQIYVLSKKSKQLTRFDCENPLFLVVSCLFEMGDVFSLDIFFYNIRNLFKAIKLIVMNPQKSCLFLLYYHVIWININRNLNGFCKLKILVSLKKLALVIIYLIIERMDCKYS